MQQNPMRQKKARSCFGQRGPKRRLIDGIWMEIPACSCCFLHNAKLRHRQERLSKQKTLRSHRKGVA